MPVAPRNTCIELKREADETVWLFTPLDFYGVGQWYREFPQISDAEVQHFLNRSTEQAQRPAA